MATPPIWSPRTRTQRRLKVVPIALRLPMTNARQSTRTVPDLLTDFKGRSVLVTGHTGFKGSWLALWLNQLGARVAGYALDPPTSPNHFDAARVAEVLADDVRGDIRDAELVEKALQKS